MLLLLPVTIAGSLFLWIVSTDRLNYALDFFLSGVLHLCMCNVQQNNTDFHFYLYFEIKSLYIFFSLSIFVARILVSDLLFDFWNKKIYKLTHIALKIVKRNEKITTFSHTHKQCILSAARGAQQIDKYICMCVCFQNGIQILSHFLAITLFSRSFSLAHTWFYLVHCRAINTYKLTHTRT